jgi:flavodoxin
MKILIIVKSKHIGNTMMIAEAMSEVAPVTICQLSDVANYKVENYDIVGYGSGIYFGKHDKELFDYVSKLDEKPSYSFVFSTSGSTNFEKNNDKLKAALNDKNKKVLGTFGCKGLDKFFMFKLVGGLNKNHPDFSDFENAQNFILDIIEKYNAEKAKSASN